MCFFIYSEQLNFYIYKTFEVVMGSGSKFGFRSGLETITSAT